MANSIVTVSGAEKIRKEMTILFMEQDNVIRADEKKAEKYDWNDRQQAENYMMACWGRVCDHLQERCAKDPVFNAKVMSPRKSLKGLVAYLTAKAKRLILTDNVAMVEDADVFNWASDYYDEDSLKADEEKAEEEAKKAAEKKAKEAEKKKSTKKTSSKKSASKAKAKSEPVKTETETKTEPVKADVEVKAETKSVTVEKPSDETVTPSHLETDGDGHMSFI